MKTDLCAHLDPASHVRRGCLHCYTPRLRPKSRLATPTSALEGLRLSALPGLLQLPKREEFGHVWSLFCSSCPAEGVMDRGKAESAPEGLHNLVKYEFHWRTIWPVTSSRCRVLREKQKDKASMEPSFLQLPVICSSGNTRARGSFCTSSSLQGSLYSQQK